MSEKNLQKVMSVREREDKEILLTPFGTRISGSLRMLAVLDKTNPKRYSS